MSDIQGREGGPTELPHGTVTFLFTDLEVSTRLWEEQPDAMRDALVRHDRILRDAVATHDGYLVKGTGDGVHAAFATAPSAVAAAIAAQLAIAAEDWELTQRLRVRMGIHAGVAELRDGDYFGSDVNRAARVMAAAHGGQILCTLVVEELVRDRFDLIDLGEHELRDVHASQRLFQVGVPGDATDHPPPRTVSSNHSNLPHEASSFVGRVEELQAVEELLTASRVVSVIGAGGVGKTRLALQIGADLVDRYADGVWLCELAPVADAAELHDAVARALGYTPPPGTSVVDGLARFLEQKSLLLILDNCEHLVRAVATFVSETTTHAARVSVLATSREGLGVRGEHLVPLAPLDLPVAGDPTSVLVSGAGALFVARAREVRPDLVVDESTARDIQALCTRLDGIPLALELAAAQTSVMTPGEITRRLDQQFRLLTGGQHNTLERHQTLRAAIDWSYDLLDDDEATLLDRLSVCSGGFDLDAVAAMAGPDADELHALTLLRALVGKSLVERNDRAGTTRYRILEMIRQYAAERLDAADHADAARDLHAGHFLSVARTVFEQMQTGQDTDALDALEADATNIAAALRWLLENERFAELMAFFGALPFVDGFAIAPAALADLAAVADDIVTRPGLPADRALATACWFCSIQRYSDGDLDRYRELAQITHRFVDDETIAVGLVMDSVLAMFDGDVERAADLAVRAADRARRGGDDSELAWTLAHSGMMLDPVASQPALDVVEEAIAAASRVGSRVARLYPLATTAVVAQATDPARALAASEEINRIDVTRRRWWTTVAQSMAVNALWDRGDIVGGLRMTLAIQEEHHRNGERFTLSMQITMAARFIAHADPEAAIELAAIAETAAFTPVAAFTMHAVLGQLAEERPADVAAARARSVALDYEEAFALVVEVIEGVIARQESTGA